VSLTYNRRYRHNYPLGPHAGKHLSASTEGHVLQLLPNVLQLADVSQWSFQADETPSMVHSVLDKPGLGVVRLVGHKEPVDDIHQALRVGLRVLRNRVIKARWPQEGLGTAPLPVSMATRCSALRISLYALNVLDRYQQVAELVVKFRPWDDRVIVPL
jgi:hypothetical protein